MKLFLAGAVVVAAIIHLGLYAAQESRNERAPIGAEPEQRITMKGWPGAYIIGFLLVMFFVPE